MTIIDSTCWERGCPCYDSRDGSVGIVVQKREWVGMTKNEIEELSKWADEHAAPWHLEYARAIEAKLKEKNT